MRTVHTMNLSRTHLGTLAEFADPRSDREIMLDRAARDVAHGFTAYGSIANWPTLSLTNDQYPRCTCTCARTAHRLVGTDRGPCTSCATCRMFVAAERHPRGART